MKYLQFLIWWWNRRSVDEKWGTVFVGLIVSIVPMCLLFGLKGFLIVLITIASFFLLGLLYFLWTLVFDQWKKYTAEKDREAQEIVNRLTGRSRF